MGITRTVDLIIKSPEAPVFKLKEPGWTGLNIPFKPSTTRIVVDRIMIRRRMNPSQIQAPPPASKAHSPSVYNSTTAKRLYPSK